MRLCGRRYPGGRRRSRPALRGDGNDRVNSYTGGNDRFWGGAGDDFDYGYTGNETILGEAGADTLKGWSDNDVIEGGADADTIDGGNDVDTGSYAHSSAAVQVTLGSNGGAAEGGDAAGDLLYAVENLTGSRFADELHGDAGVNVLNGGRGDDLLAGGQGADTLIGGAGNDTFDGGLGDDLIKGGKGVDTLDYTGLMTGVSAVMPSGVAWTPGAERDIFSGIENVIGGDGNDLLVGGAGADFIDGGAGIDTVSYAGEDDSAIVIMNNLLFLGGATGEMLLNVENTVGTDYGDLLGGNGVANKLLGGAGDDLLIGYGGRDALTGGEGADIFALVTAADSGTTKATADVATDFSLADGDTFDLSVLDAVADTTDYDAFTFIGDAAFTAAGQARAYNDGAGHTIVELNMSGTSGAEMMIVVDGAPVLTVDQFVL